MRCETPPPKNGTGIIIPGRAATFGNFRAPDREWAVVVLSNFSSPSGEMLGGQLLDFLAKLPR